MPLSTREGAVALVSAGIATYSILQAQGKETGASMIDYVLRSIPEEKRGEISMEMIDEVFAHVTESRRVP